MRRAIIPFCLLLSLGAAACAQTPDPLAAELRTLTDTVAVSGYELPLIAKLRSQLAAFHPRQDSMGNLTVTFGSGAPYRLIAAPVDEPGFVVSEIEPDGYLRVQRLPQFGLWPHYNEMQHAQPMVIETKTGTPVAAVSAGLSIHLAPGRLHPPDPEDIENLYIDMGATSAADVRRAGVDLLSPLAEERHLAPVGLSDWSGTAVGDRFGAAALVELAQALSKSQVHGTVTLAFTVQQWAGSRGLSRVLEELHPDELVYVGRAVAASQADPLTSQSLGSGVWMYGPAEENGANPLEDAAKGADITIQRANAAGVLGRGYGKPVPLPNRSVHLGIPLRWPETAGETLDEHDLQTMLRLLGRYAGATVPAMTTQQPRPIAYPPMPPKPTTAPATEKLLEVLTTTYGVSEHEDRVRAMVQHLMPPWAHPTVDAAGNVVLQYGDKHAAPEAVFMAHMDELGFRISAIRPDGSLELENKGGGTPAFYWGHPALVHTASGMRNAVVELPEDYQTTAFHLPADFRAPASLFVGAANPEQVAVLGIHVGDTVTIPKRFLHLADGRVSIRSLDDRVGCAALLRAVWELGPSFHRNVTFVWSTREELGLLGAGEFAVQAAAEHRIPKTVFAIDTFVSSDSPLESKRFADGELGKGFVIRAIDNSNIAPWPQVLRLEQFAGQHGIAVQYGVTGGGNDGAMFQRYGAIDLPLSWPLRYAHSPAELIDLRDLNSLAAITTALAKDWK